jgi:hypothetical protein
MYINISTSILHTHGLVPCTQDFILHNPIDEHLNLQKNNVRSHNKPCQTLHHRVIPPHQVAIHVHCLFPKAFPHIRYVFHNRPRMYATYSRSTCVCMQLIPRSPTCASVDKTLELPFSLSFCSDCSVFFSELEL